MDNTYSGLNRFKDVQFIGSGRYFQMEKQVFKSLRLLLFPVVDESPTDTTTVETGDGKDLAYVQAISSKQIGFGIYWSYLSLNVG